MGRQKPPDSTGKLTGFPYRDFWEELGEPWEPLYIDGRSREVIRRSFERARELKAAHLDLAEKDVSAIIRPLQLPAEKRAQLTDQLFYLAGHYYSPRFHQLDGDAPAQVRKLLTALASTARRLESKMGDVTPAVWRHVGGARLNLGERRRADTTDDWSILRHQIADLATSAQVVADEFPQFRRGTTEKVLLGRWLRQSAEAMEKATDELIDTRTRDTAGKNYCFIGTLGEVYERYCKRVDKGLMTKTLVSAVREYQRHGFGGRPARSPKPPI